MQIIDVLGKPCPIPVIEARKALSDQDVETVLIKADNMIAVQNLERMANGLGYSFGYEKKSESLFEITINKEGKAPPPSIPSDTLQIESCVLPTDRLVVVIGRDTMGAGAEDLGKILIKGFIYSLTELPIPPMYIIFLNSGAYLTSEEANTIDDLKRLEEKGTEIYTCGTCSNFYGLQDKLAVGSITDMYGITEKMASATNLI
ncbi:MAG: sulfurtransferase-like selenium metabolism protein YedF, partial [Eubacteriales bacterium]|nr:sulfurtransferase-like selenium metabolism protein YedF [Eubacteriales bacterium]